MRLQFVEVDLQFPEMRLQFVEVDLQLPEVRLRPWELRLQRRGSHLQTPEVRLQLFRAEMNPPLFDSIDPNSGLPYAYDSPNLAYDGILEPGTLPT